MSSITRGDITSRNDSSVLLPEIHACRSADRCIDLQTGGRSCCIPIPFLPSVAIRRESLLRNVTLLTRRNSYSFGVTFLVAFGSLSYVQSSSISAALIGSNKKHDGYTKTYRSISRRSKSKVRPGSSLESSCAHCCEAHPIGVTSSIGYRA